MAETEVSIRKLNQENPEYANFKIAWQKIELLVESGERLKLNAQGILTKRPKEPNDVWYTRLQHFTSTPILGVALGWYRSALFKRQPEIAQAAPTPSPEAPPLGTYYVDYLKNCDRQGTKFVDQAKIMFDHLMQFGRAWIQIDAPAANSQPQSLLEEQMMGLDAPYSLIKDPREIINWSTDDFGNLDWVLTRTIEEPDVFLSDLKPKVVWVYYDRKGYRRYEADLDKVPMLQQNSVEASLMQKSDVAKLVDQGPHVLAAYNTVPFKRVVVPSALWLANRVYLMCLDYLNTENSHSWNLFQANLAMPIIYSDTEPSLILSEVGLIKLGQDDKFGWTEPEGKSFHASEERLNALREEIFRCVYLIAAGRSSNSTASMQSGFSKTLDWAPANDVLNAYGDLVRGGMEGVLKMIAFARRDEKANFFVRGFRFETRPATETVALADETNALMIPSSTLRRELQKRVVRDVLEDSDDNLILQACKEIDDAPDPEVAMATATDQQFQQSFSRLSDRGEVKDELGSVSGGGDAA